MLIRRLLESLLDLPECLVGDVQVTAIRRHPPLRKRSITDRTRLAYMNAVHRGGNGISPSGIGEIASGADPELFRFSELRICAADHPLQRVEFRDRRTH